MTFRNIDDLIKDLWENRAVGIQNEPLDFISKETIAYLRECYPYLQMISMNAKFEDVVIPKFIPSPSSGWIIHDYGQAMSSSPGRYLVSLGKQPTKEEEEAGTGSGAGTLTRQTVDTAKAMINLAIEKGWPGVELIAGTELMQWAAWFAAQEKNYPLAGYALDTKGQKRFDRIKRIEREHAAEADIALARKGGGG